MQVRRVVTGQTVDGKSVVVGDGSIDPITVSMLPGTEFHRIWGMDEPAKLPSTGEQPVAPAWFPPAGGFRFAFFTLAPDAPPPDGLDMEAAMGEFEQKVPGLAATLEPDAPGMHTSDTIDVQFIVSGEVWLELDDGVEVHLLPGDCVVQNGTRHAWRNRSDRPCVMAVASAGASR